MRKEHSIKAGAGKDIRVIGTEVSPWRERKGHRLKRSMIAAVCDQDVGVLILGTGVYGAIKCPKKVKDTIHEHGISELILQPTPSSLCHLQLPLPPRQEGCPPGPRDVLIETATARPA